MYGWGSLSWKNECNEMDIIHIFLSSLALLWYVALLVNYKKNKQKKLLLHIVCIMLLKIEILLKKWCVKSLKAVKWYIQYHTTLQEI